MTYGTGSIMSVPAHDQRDHDFGKKYDLTIQPVSKPIEKDASHDFNEEAYIEEGIPFNSGKYDGINSADAKDQIGEMLTDKVLQIKSLIIAYEIGWFLGNAIGGLQFQF